MTTQYDDLQYGYDRECKNHHKLEEFLDCDLRKLDKYSIMDWEEVVRDGDESPKWLVEQKARKVSYSYLLENYKSPLMKYPSALIGKNKLDYMKYNGGNGIVVFDFTDKIMYWQFDEKEYAKMEVETKFIRSKRVGCVDKPHPVVHIPCSLLEELV